MYVSPYENKLTTRRMRSESRGSRQRPAKKTLESPLFTFTEHVLGHTHTLHKINPDSTLISIPKHLAVFIKITSSGVYNRYYFGKF